MAAAYPSSVTAANKASAVVTSALNTTEPAPVEWSTCEPATPSISFSLFITFALQFPQRSPSTVKFIVVPSKLSSMGGGDGIIEQASELQFSTPGQASAAPLKSNPNVNNIDEVRIFISFQCSLVGAITRQISDDIGVC